MAETLDDLCQKLSLEDGFDEVSVLSQAAKKVQQASDLVLAGRICYGNLTILMLLGILFSKRGE